MLGAIQLGDLEQTILSTSKACIFTHPFECASCGALLVLLGIIMNNSLSAYWQVLIKKSGRTIEHLAPNSDVVNLKCFSFEVAFIYPFIKKQLIRTLRTPSEWRSFPSCLVILYQPFIGKKGTCRVPLLDSKLVRLRYTVLPHLKSSGPSSSLTALRMLKPVLWTLNPVEPQ